MSDETVIGVIPTARIKTGFFTSKACTLVFTDRRLILKITIETAAGKPPYETDGEKPKLGEARAHAASVIGPAVR